MKVIPATRGVY